MLVVAGSMLRSMETTKSARAAEPKNANQLAIALEVDYRTIRHHLKILEENGLITSIGDQYGKMFFTSIELEENWAIFEEIWKEIGKRLKKGDKE